jgi:hypothetical protein
MNPLKQYILESSKTPAVPAKTESSLEVKTVESKSNINTHLINLIFNTKYSNKAKSFTHKESILYNLLDENPDEKSLIDKIDLRYKQELKYDLQRLKKIEDHFLLTNNKSKLETDIKQLESKSYSQYNPLDNFITNTEFIFYSLSLILVCISFMMIVKLAITRLLKSCHKKDNTKANREDLSNDNTIYLNINSNQLKKSLFSLILAFTICSFLQLSKLNLYKEKIYATLFYEKVSSINNIDYSFHSSDEVGYVGSSFEAYTYFDNHFNLPYNLYEYKSSWKGLYIKDFYDYKFNILKLILENTLKDYVYWILIGLSIFSLQLVYKKYLKRLKINIS